MNVKTTIALVVLLLVGGAAYYVWVHNRPREAQSATADFLEKQLTPQTITYIEVKRGKKPGFVLTRKSPADEWTLPGQWPAREKEVEQLVKTVAGLHTRFASYSYDDKKSVLEHDPLTLTVRVDGKDHVLTMAEEPSDSNRFTRPTYLRLDKSDEVLRLAPGLVTALDRNEEYFRMRRLFPSERIVKEDSLEKVQQVAAKDIEVAYNEAESKDDKQPARKTRYEIAKKDEGWEMIKPAHDRVEPDKVKNLLAFLPNIWAESFVDKKSRSLAELGLDPPRVQIRVTRPTGGTLDLLVGSVSKLDVRKELKPPPPGPPGMPQEPRIELVKEEYRYAKLADNELIFEVKGDKLDEKVPADPGKLRDPRLARFESRDARRLEVDHPGEKIVLLHDKDSFKWQLQSSGQTLPAETSQVTELLGKLSGLEVQEKDIRDDNDLARYGLDKPLAVIKVAAEETKAAGDKKTKTTQDYVFRIGKSDKEKGKVFVRVDGWPRINAVDEAILPLIQRPALAYRSRRILDSAARDLARIDIRRDKDSYSFEQIKGTWKQIAPVAAEVDSGKVSSLADDLANVEAVEYVADNPKADDLDKLYGLGKPQLEAKIQFTEKDKKSHTLIVGKRKETKEKPAAKEPEKKDAKEKEKNEYYARLDQGPIFVVKKELRDELDRDVLAYQSEKPIDVAAADVGEITLRQGADALKLKRDDKGWKIVAPFEAPAAPKLADSLAEALANLKVQRYVALSTKDTDHGLAKPHLSITVTPRAGGNDKKEEPKEKPRTLLIGAVVKDSKSRYARLDNAPAVFTLSESDVATLERKPNDLLSRDVLELDPSNLDKVSVRGTTSFGLVRKEKAWQIVDAPSASFTAEADKVQSFLQHFKELKAAKVADYGPKVDLAKYGLDKPATTLTLVGKADKDKKPSEHTVTLGKEAEAGQRYARVDNGPGIYVLDEFTVRDLTPSYLDFANLALLKIDSDNVVSLSRQMAGNDVEVARKGETWFFKDKPADAPTIQEILRETRNLRAERIAEYPAKNPASFGLDKPAAIITLKLEAPDGKTSQHVIKLGKAVGEPGKGSSGSRYAMVDKGEAIAVLPADLSRRLLAASINFSDHNLVNLFGADQAILEREGRRAVFARVDGMWKLTEPVQAEAEETALFDLTRRLTRLRADELVAEKADAKSYGLEKPKLQWKLRLADQDVLTLLVGNPESGQKNARLYAKLASKDVVFLLDPTLSAKVREEYRKRKPWESFDAAQVERVSVRASKESFQLTKLGKEWSVLTMPEMKVESTRVSDLLDALARLEVQRYVADAKADLQLYGLTPPIYSVELDLPTGKRALHLGRMEGTSQRAYATIPGSDSVFLLSESDTQKIARPLSAYVAANKDTKASSDR